MRVECSVHQDDWVHVVAHKDYQGKLFWCPECDALWFNRENLLKKAQMFGVTFTRAQSFGELIGNEHFELGIEDMGEYMLSDAD